MLVQRGELDEAEKLLFGKSPSARRRSLTGTPPPRCSRARRPARGAGRVGEGAEEALREAGRWSTATDVVNPSVAPWRSPLIHALLDLGQDEEARRLAADELERARRFGSPRALGVALVASGRVEGGQAEIKMLREAIDVLDGSPALLETGAGADRAGGRAAPVGRPARGPRAAARGHRPGPPVRGPRARGPGARRASSDGSAAPAPADRGAARSPRASAGSRSWRRAASTTGRSRRRCS